MTTGAMTYSHNGHRDLFSSTLPKLKDQSSSTVPTLQPSTEKKNVTDTSKNSTPVC